MSTQDNGSRPTLPGAGLKVRHDGGTANYPRFSVHCNYLHWADVSGRFDCADLMGAAGSLGMTYEQLGALVRLLNSGQAWRDTAAELGIDALA